MTKDNKTEHLTELQQGILTSWRSFVVRTLVASVLLYSGWSKVFLPYDFLSILYGYELLGQNAGLIAAIVLPWIEITLGMMLLTNSAITSTLFLSSFLLLLFVVIRVSVLLRGLVIPCGCYGIGDDVVNWQNTMTTFLLFFIVVIEFCRCVKTRKIK